MENYELRKCDFVPFKGCKTYRSRNSYSKKTVSRLTFLYAYNTLVTLTGLIAAGAAIEGLEKLLR